MGGLPTHIKINPICGGVENENIHHNPLLNTQNHCEKLGRSYRNKKSHEITGYLEAILRVLELNTPQLK